MDWVLEHQGRFLPIETKLSDRPTERDAKHLGVFMDEYRARAGLIVCTAPRTLRLNPRVTAVPWQSLPEVLRASVKAMR